MIWLEDRKGAKRPLLQRKNSGKSVGCLGFREIFAVGINWLPYSFPVPGVSAGKHK